MKARKHIIAVFLLLISICVAATGQNDPVQVSKLVDFLALGTGSMTGTYFPLGNAFANAWTTRSEKLSVLAHSTRGSLDNINLMQNLELDLAVAQSDMVLAAINGTGQFAGSPVNGLRVLLALYPEVVQVLTPASATITNISQLRGKRIVVGARGSGNAMTSVELLSAMGVREGHYQPLYLGYDESIQAMERGECDAAIIIAGIPTKMVDELARRMPVRIMNFSDADLASISETLPYLSGVKIPAQTYGGVNEEVKVPALMAMLVTTTRLSEELGNRLVATLFAELDYLKTIHERAHDIKPETMLNGIPEGFLHAGTARFIRESGLKAGKKTDE